LKASGPVYSSLNRTVPDPFRKIPQLFSILFDSVKTIRVLNFIPNSEFLPSED
jgi:hypothetical protein